MDVELITVKRGLINTSSGLEVFYRHWPTSIESNRIILCIHGLCGDSRNFTYSAEKFSKMGYDVYSLDLPGFGNSGGEKGDVLFDDVITSINDLVIQITKKSYNLFILGFSLGGLYALHYASKYTDRLSGIAILAPLLRFKGVNDSWRVKVPVTKLLACFVNYAFAQSKKVDQAELFPNGLGKNAGEEWRYMSNDPLCNFRYSYRYVFELFLRRSRDTKTISKITIPTLVLHGDKDDLIPIEQSKHLMSLLNSNDKELKIFDCDHWFYHAFFYTQHKYSEAQRMKVITTIHDWIEQRSKVALKENIS